MNRHAYAPVIVFLTLAFALAAVGCSSSGASAQAAPAPSSSSAASSSSAVQVKTLGEVSAKGAAIEFTNKVGKDITAVAVKATGEAEYSASLFAADEEIASGETVDLLFGEIPAQEGGAQRLADLSVTLADGAVYELHQVALFDIVEATMRIEGDVAYLEYTTENGASASSLEDEKALAAQAAAEAEAEAAAAEEAAAEAAAAEEAYSYDSSYADVAYVDDSAVGSGNEEACIDDIVLR